MKSLIFLLFIAGCSSQIGTQMNEYGLDPVVLFCPRDNCSKALVDFIETSDNVSCAFYDLNIKEVESALSSKGARLVLNDDSRLNSKNLIMHNKFCVTENMVLTGSFNPTFNGAYKNNNNLVIVKSKTIEKVYKEEFLELWGGEFGEGKPTINGKIKFNSMMIEALFCPEDNCTRKVSGLISNANQSVYFMAFSFTNPAIANELALAMHRGVVVKGIIEARQVNKYSKFGMLRFQGVDVIRDSNPYNMHHKVFIIDKKIVITGSANPTKRGYAKNDENILVIKDKKIANIFLDEFERLKKEKI